MAGAVGDVGDEPGVAAGRVGLEFVEQRAEGVHDVDVRLFVPAAHVVDLARGAAGEHGADGAAVVGDEQPVADLLAVAIHGQRLAGERVGDHQRDELFREVVGAVVVGAVAGGDRQAVGVVPGAHEVVGGGFAGRVRAVGLVGFGLGKGRIVGAEGAVHFVGADVVEAEGGLGVGLERAPVAAGGFEQGEGAVYVGADEVAGAVNRAIDVAFGGKVDDGAGAVLGQQAVDQLAVADVALHKDVARVALERGEVLQVARVGEGIQIDHRLVAHAKPVEYEVCTDKAGAAGYENHESPWISRSGACLGGRAIQNGPPRPGRL